MTRRSDISIRTAWAHQDHRLRRFRIPLLGGGIAGKLSTTGSSNKALGLALDDPCSDRSDCSVLYST